MRGDILGVERRRRWSDEDKLSVEQAVVTGIAINLQDAIEALQNINRVFTAAPRCIGDVEPLGGVLADYVALCAACTERLSDLLCMSKMVHASPTKEHDDNDDFQGTTGRAA